MRRPRHSPDLDEDFESIEVRHELRRQIARLEAELASAPGPSGGLPTAPGRAEAHVAGVEELEQTRDVLIAKLSEAQRAARAETGRERARQRGEAASPEGPLEQAMSWWRNRS